MSQRELNNTPASVRARLLNEAKRRGESYDQMLQYFAIERFLYRLSKSEWGERFVVKGAIMLRAWGMPLGRPTRDIDPEVCESITRFIMPPIAAVAGGEMISATWEPGEGWI